MGGEPSPRFVIKHSSRRVASRRRLNQLTSFREPRARTRRSQHAPAVGPLIDCRLINNRALPSPVRPSRGERPPGPLSLSFIRVFIDPPSKSSRHYHANNRFPRRHAARAGSAGGEDAVAEQWRAPGATARADPRRFIIPDGKRSRRSARRDEHVGLDNEIELNAAGCGTR